MFLFDWFKRKEVDRAALTGSVTAEGGALRVDVIARDDGAYMVLPCGRLDTTTAPLFEKKLNALLVPNRKVLIFDLAQLVYLSSAGVRIIFKARKFMDEHHHTFLMTNLQPQIQKVFDIVNALPSEHVFKDMSEVDNYLDVMQRKEVEKQ